MTAEGVGSMKQRLVVKRSPGIANLTNSFTVPDPRSPVCSRIQASPSGEFGSISFHRKIGAFVFKCVIENAPFSCVEVIPFNGLSLLTKTQTASAAMVIWMIFFFVADSIAFFSSVLSALETDAKSHSPAMNEAIPSSEPPPRTTTVHLG